MSIPKSADVVVVGSGPAGSIAATRLAQLGHDVVIVEKEKHPRPRVGESLIPDAWKYLDLVGVSEKIDADGFIEKAGAIISWNAEARAHTFGDFGYVKPALHIERDRFDQILFEHAKSQGVTALEETTVTGVDLSAAGESGEGATVLMTLNDGTHAKIECRYVVDCSGQSAILGRQLGIRSTDDGFRYLGIWGYWKDAKYLSLDTKVHEPSELGDPYPVTFITSLDEAGDGGWSWHIMLRDETSIGLVLPIELVKTARENGESWASYYERRCRNVPVLSKLLEEATLRPGSVTSIRDYSNQSEKLAGPGWFLAGDAAGFVDPIFSVGVILALFGGASAAWAVDRVLTRPDLADRVFTMYTSQLGGRFEVARSLALPRYKGGDHVTDVARQMVGLERKAMKEIMYVVSEFTTRSENWMEMMGEEAPDLSDEQMRMIGKLEV